MESKDLDFEELQQTAATFEQLAAKPEIFNEAHAAFLADSPERFEAAINKAGIADRCHLVCHLFCQKHCGAFCRKFCPERTTVEVNAAEVLDFTKAIIPLLKDQQVMLELNAIMDKQDVGAWNEFLKKFKLERFCHQLCALLCSWRCTKKCHRLCPPKPLITRIGSIPVAQINTLGYGNGPSIPPFYVGNPNPPAGYGDHPFGGQVWLMGIFNMPSATEYLVEVSSTGPGGTYDPILVGPQGGYDTVPTPNPQPVPPDTPSPGDFLFYRTRSQSPNPDPGWFKIIQLTDSDGGRLTTGEKTLLMWPTFPTLPDGVYHLRLRVRDAAMNTRVSSPQVVLLDNSGPFPLPRPTIQLQLEKPDGTLVPLKCGKVRKGDGLIKVTIHAYDPNMSSVSVTARGNSGLSVPVVSTTAVPLSKTYNGNIADQGYPVPTSFLWDPWSDPNIVPCCYLVYVEINDRTIIGNTYTGGHSNAGWEAIEIGF